MSDTQRTTSGSFDPYHKLLGISRKDQPPTYYRLLGIEELEDDADVIEAAADKQMSYLQSCRNGEHAAEAEQLLNEVSEARLHLLNPELKFRYDDQLQASRLSNPPPQLEGAEVEGPHPPPLRVSDTASAVQLGTTSHRASVRHRASARHRKRGRKITAWYLVAAVLVALVVLVVWQRGALDSQALPLTDRPATEADPAPSGQASGEQAVQMPAGGEGSADLPGPTGIAESTELAEPADEAPSDTNRLASETGLSPGGQEEITPSDDLADVSVDSSAPQSPPSSASVGREEAEASRSMTQGLERDRVDHPPVDQLPVRGEAEFSDVVERLPKPTAGELAEQEVEILEALDSRIRAANSPYEKQILATFIYQLSEEDAEPATCFALLQKSIELFLEAGDLTGAMAAIDRLVTRFDVDQLEERLPVLEELEPVLFRPLDRVRLADRAETLIDVAMKRGDLVAAAKLCLICKKVSRDLRNPAMAKKFSAIGEEIQFWRRKAKLIVLARRRIQTESENPKANELLGWFECFAKGNWDEGTAYLVKATSTKLRELAAIERAGVSEAAEMADLADLWWELSNDPNREPLLGQYCGQRAAHWYQKALARDLSGLQKVAAKTRLEQVRDEILAFQSVPNEAAGEPSRPPGVPEEAKYFNGNWYLFSKRPARREQAVSRAKAAGGRLVVIRSQQEHDFLVENGRRPLMLGMRLEHGEWVDFLGERQLFFLWDEEHGEPDSQSDRRSLSASVSQPDEGTSASLAAISDTSDLWADYHEGDPMFYVIEWGRE